MPLPTSRSRSFFVLAVVMALGLVACSNSTLDLFDPNAGLIAHWALDEAIPGSTATDASGLGSDATPSATPPIPSTETPPVHFADPYSLSFDGKTQWLDLGNPAILNLGGALTITAWIRATAFDGTRNILSHGFRATPAQEVALRFRSGEYQFTFWNVPDHYAHVAIPATDMGTWVHLAGVFDGARYLLYKNGELVAQTADTTTPTPNIDASWGIGGRIPPVGDDERRLFQGFIDDIRVYGRALSAGEIGALARR